MPVPQPCPRCSKRLPPEARFCRRCGVAVAARTAGPAIVRPAPSPRISVASEYSRRQAKIASAAQCRPGPRWSMGRLMPLIAIYFVLMVISRVCLAPRSIAPPTRVRLPGVPYVQPRFSTPMFVAPTAPIEPRVTAPYPPPDVLYPAYPNDRDNRDWDRPGIETDRHERKTH